MADAFYMRHPFSVKHIRRYNTGSEADIIKQRMDIDVQLNFEHGCYEVSEKFRDHDYGDLLLEIYSKYPQRPGWIQTSKAQRLAYFFPKRMFWIDEVQLKTFCLEELFPKVAHTAIELLLSQEANSLKLGLRLQEKLYHCVLNQARNVTNDASWNTISISVPFVMLQDAAVRFKQYSL